MFLERFKEVENFTITKLPLGGSKRTGVKINTSNIFINAAVSRPKIETVGSIAALYIGTI